MASVIARKLANERELEQQQYRGTVKEAKHAKKQWITAGEKLIYSIIIIATICTCLYIVAYSGNIDAVNRDVESLQVQIKDQRLINDSLQSEVMYLSEPSRILEVAKQNGLSIQNATVEQAKFVR